MKPDTTIVTAGRNPDANFGIVNPPVYHASTVLHPTVAHLEATRRNAQDPNHRGVFYGRPRLSRSKTPLWPWRAAPDASSIPPVWRQ